MTRTSLPLGHRLRSHWSLAAVMGVYLITLAFMPPRGLWIVDNANRYLQIQALADANFGEYAIRWPGRDVDPGYEMNPLRFNPEGTFEAFKDGQLISVFQPAFLVLGAVAFKLLGPLGINLLPIIGAGLMLAAVSTLGRRLGYSPTGRHLAVLLAGLATPTWFYSQNLWEHTLAAALCMWGVVGIICFFQDASRRPLVLGCACLAAAVFLRDVLGLFAVTLLGLLVMRRPEQRRRILVASGVVLGVGGLLLLAFQWWVVARPLGFHADTLMGGGGLVEHLAKRPRIFYLYFVAAHPLQAVSFALALPYLVAFAVRPRLTATRINAAVPLWSLAAAVAGAVYLAGFLAAPSALRHMLSANSFFVAAPVLVLGLLRTSGTRRGCPAPEARDFLLTTACLYILLYCLVAPWAGAVSLHWGGRLQFCLYPLLAVLAAGTLADWFESPGRRARLALAPIGLLLVVSVACQAYSVKVVRDKKLYSERLAQAMSTIEPTVVVTDVWWVGHELYASFFDRSVFYVRSQAQLEALGARLHAQGIRRFVWATRPRAGSAPTGAVRVDDGGWDFYSLDLLVSDLRGSAPRPD
ncbi:MAG: hypothetical protein IPO18_03975 [bacterium]|nr:hypothetical protein [bacterium]